MQIDNTYRYNIYDNMFYCNPLKTLHFTPIQMLFWKDTVIPTDNL